MIGSNSFTGSHIVDALLADASRRVIGVSRSPEYKALFLPYKQRAPGNFQFCQIDIVTRFHELVCLLEEVRPQIVINVAALSEVGLSNEQPVEYFETNTVAVVKLCNYLRKRSFLERYVHVSSAEVYGSCQRSVSEETLFNPSTPYAASKAAADMYLNTLLRNFDFPTTLIRSTNVYGKHQQLFKIIPRTVIYLKLGKTIDIHGGGVAAKSFVHIRDVVRGLMLAIDRGDSGTYQFSVPNEQSIAAIIRLICVWMGYDFDSATRSVGERLGQDARYLLDCSKARQDLDWEPQVSFEEGVQEVIAWIGSNWDQVIQESLVYQHRA